MAGQRVSARNGSRPEQRRVEAVALVTSAGGLEALSSVLRALPADFPAAVVVAQHLGGQGSKLVEVLARRIELPLEWARDGCRISPGLVTVCPPRMSLEVLPDRTCALHPVGSGATEQPLSALLISLADSVGERAAGVVLTGMGRDGASGAEAIRNAGGFVIAQRPDTAEQPAMPRAVVEVGAADLVLPLYEVGPALAAAALGHPLPRPREELDAVREIFGEEGEVAALARETDWSLTPLGRVTDWPVELRTVMRLAMGSPWPSCVMCTEDLLLLYNEAAVPTLGGRLAEIFARPIREASGPSYRELAPMLTSVLGGTPAEVNALLIPFERAGGIEDAWFDAVYSPVHGARETVLGIHCSYYERTGEVLAARRLTTLNRLAVARRQAGRRPALELALETLEADEDVPFALAYLLNPRGTGGTLAGAFGVEEGSALAPRDVRLAPGLPWPLAEVVERGEGVVLEDLGARFRGRLVGSEQLPPTRAWVAPLRDDAEDRVVAVLVLGTHPRLPLDAAYRDFLATTGATIAAMLSDAEAARRERQRLERLAELDRAKTEFFSNVSHEFRTPLTLMLGPLDEVLQDDDAVPAVLREELVLVRRNARRLLRLVGTMLDFSQIEAGRLRAQFAPVDLVARTREIAAQFESAAERAGLTLSLDLETLPEKVWVDAEMWEKIVSNLLSNALKFTFDGGIDVTLRPLPKHAELVVRDTGVGIPEEELPHVFKRFHRVRDTRARTIEGAGIGLALVDELVRRHHGRVRVTSTVGEGTTFTVWVPLGRRPAQVEAPAPPAAAPEVAAAMAQEAQRWGGTPEPDVFEDDDGARRALGEYAPSARVLIADDSQDMRDYLSRLLAPHWAVELAADGADALTMARGDSPDLILADVMMPGLDGFALLRELRSDAALSTIPVVLITARAGEESAIEGLLAGADDYIVKPFSARELVARVGGQLELSRARRRHEERQAFLLRFSDLLRAEPDADRIAESAIRLLSEQMRLDRCYVVRYVLEDDRAYVTHQLGNDSVPPLPCELVLSDYPEALEVVREQTFVVEDDFERRGLSDEERRNSAALGMRAMVASTVRRGKGSPLWSMAAVSSQPRRWTPDEVALVEEAAERTWAAVERARAEMALRDSETRQAFLLGLSDALRPLADAAEIKRTAAILLGRHLGVDRAFWSEMVEDEWVIDDVFEPAGSSLASGRYPAGVYGRWTMDSLRAGRLAAIGDTAADERLQPPEREALRGIGVAAVVGVPLLRDGEVVATLSAHSHTPRAWTEEELELVRETADRTWPAVERARAEAVLRESEARFRVLAEASPLGVAVTEVNKSVIVYANRAYAAIIGYEPSELEGQPSTRVYYDPADRSWLAEMREAGRITGREVRFKHKDGSPVWVSINVAPISFGGRPAIIGVVQDISARRNASNAEAPRSKARATPDSPAVPPPLEVPRTPGSSSQLMPTIGPKLDQVRREPPERDAGAP